MCFYSRALKMLLKIDYAPRYLSPYSRGALMYATWKVILILLTIVITSSTQIGTTQNPVYYEKQVEQKATVSILAISSSIHFASGRQETYLADVLFKGNKHQLAKLVDLYPPDGYPVRLSLLHKRLALRMRLARHEQCDANAQEFFLSDDPGAIFDLSIRAQLASYADDAIPCYKVVHKATRLD